MHATRRAVIAYLLFILAVALAGSGTTREIISSAQHHIPIQASYLNLPLSFEINKGQAAPEAQFLARGIARGVFLTRKGPLFVLPNRNGTSYVQAEWIGANPHAHAAGERQLPGRVNYLLGNNPQRWRTAIPTFARVRYHGLYPMTDLIYYGNQQKLEYDLVLQPGADPTQIRMNFVGAKKITLENNGDLVIHTATGSLRQHRPVVYQRIGKDRRYIRSYYRIRGSEASIAIGNYDRHRELIIDPVMSFSTFLGGSNEDEGLAIAVDSSGHAYVAGRTISTDFPTTSGAFDRTCGADAMCGPASEPPTWDAFVAKLNSSGTKLLYATYLGGGESDSARAIALDSSGNAYVAGDTVSDDFPATFIGPGQGARVDHAFVSKLNGSGSTLLYSVEFSGSTGNGSGALGVAVDSAGQAYVTGAVEASDFPTTPGAFQPGFAGPGDGFGGDAFIVKLNASGTAFLYSTYVGGGGRDEGRAIAINFLQLCLCNQAER